jgi:hypothetical protein
MKLAAATLLLLLASTLFAQDSNKPRISAFFDRIDEGPAFFVECRNTSSEDISSGASIWASSLRIDGAIVPEEDYRGPGLTTNVKADQWWRGIIALRQSYYSGFPAPKFGALVRSARVLALSQGKHTIAIECAGVWSEEFAFYWESDTR